jgi:hypothetical protein
MKCKCGLQMEQLTAMDVIQKWWHCECGNGYDAAVNFWVD